MADITPFATKLAAALEAHEITPEVWQAARILHDLIFSLRWHEAQSMVFESAMVREWSVATTDLQTLVDKHGDAALEAFRYYQAMEDMLSTARENLDQVSSERRSLGQRRSWERGRKPNALCVNGERHPRSKPVLTPKGRFGNATEAAEIYEVTPRTAQIWAFKNVNGFSYE